MKASEAREIAFGNVGKTYEEGLNIAFNMVYCSISKAANEGHLETSVFTSSILHYFDGIKCNYVKNTIVELIRTRLIEDGYNVDVVRTNLSTDKWIDISW